MRGLTMTLAAKLTYLVLTALVIQAKIQDGIPTIGNYCWSCASHVAYALPTPWWIAAQRSLPTTSYLQVLLDL